ncbi:MAG: hypothetical protein LBV50_07960 [Novosphingobium sp.]|nr:hypothetical protein [Novosphingobium sp.]
MAGVGPSACAQSGQAVSQLTAAARACGFKDPRFRFHDGAYVINAERVTGTPNEIYAGPPEQLRRYQRSQEISNQRFSCLEEAAKRLGLRVDYPGVIIN